MKKFLFIIGMSLVSTSTLFAQWTDQSSGITNDLNDVFFINNSIGWAVGRQGKVIHTTNGGSTWAEQNSGTTQDLNKVYMVNSTIGYAVGKSGTFIKYNGTDWEAISVGYSQALHGVHFLNENTGWISGDWGRIMMTTNGGSSWTTQVDNSLYTNLFHDIHMISSTDGWAVGTSGRVLRYNGTNWSNFSTPATADLYAVHFNASGVGFMTGKNSTVFKFNGTAWSANSTALPDNSFHVYDVFVVDASLAYAATSPGFGGQGIILKYNGSSWVKDYEYTGMYSELFTGVHVSPGGRGVVVASGGIIKSHNSVSSIEEKNETLFDVLIYPNPTNDFTTVKFNLAEATPINISIFDYSGKEVLNLNSINQNTGVNELSIDMTQFDSGIYFIQISTEASILTSKKLIKL